MLAETRFGWLALAGAIGKLNLEYISLHPNHMYSCGIVFISFPPLVGHTTLVTLCGFAYGMKGFYIASSASVVGSALVFVVLRFLLSHRLRQWSTRNEKWQALEAVVVSPQMTTHEALYLPSPPFL